MDRKLRNALRYFVTVECLVVLIITTGHLWMRNPLIWVEWLLSLAWIVAFVWINYDRYFG